MNALARYLLVFLLGWSGAVWSYSGLIYKTSNTPEKTEMQNNTKDLSLPNALKPRPALKSESPSQNTKEGPSATTFNSTQPIKKQSPSQ